MPPRRVDWLNIPQQKTIVKRTPAPIPQYPPMGYPMPQQVGAFSGQQQAPAQEPAVRPQVGTFTGAGVDGAVQPGKYAGMVHEGEMVIPANAAQAIPPHIYNALIQKASAGTLDINALGTVLGVQPMAGYKTGTYSAGSSNQGEYDPMVDSNPIATNPVPKPAETMSPNASPFGISTAPQGPASNGVSDTIKPSNQGEYDPMVDPLIKPATAAPVGTIQQRQVTPEQLNIPKPVLNQAPMPTIQQPTVRQQVTPEQVGVAPRGPSEAPVFAPQKPASPAVAPQQPVGTLATENVRAGLQNLKNQMNGMSESDKRIANYYLTNTDANNAANIQVLTNAISSDPNMSESGKRMAIAGLVRDASSSRATITQGLAQTAQTRADAATRDAISTGQQIRQYEDISLPTFNKVTLPAAEQSLRAGDINAKNAISDQINARVNLLMADTNATAEQIQSDDILQGLVKQFYGGEATPDQVLGEVGSRVTSWREGSLNTFYDNLNTLMDEAKDNNSPLETVLSDQRVRSAAANVLSGQLGRAPTDQELSDFISSGWEQTNKSDLEVALEDMVQTDYLKDFVEYDAKTGKMTEKVPGVLNDLRNMISDLQTKGGIDPETNLPTDAFEWPWNDPETRFKYNDFNGNEIVSGMSTSIDPITKKDGTNYTDQTGMPITNSAATAKWNSMYKLNRTTMDKFFNENGEFDKDSAMAYMFPTATDPSGKVVNVLTADELNTKIVDEPEFASQLISASSAYSDTSKISMEDGLKEGVATTGKGGQPVSSLGDGTYHYYDKTGKLQYGNVGDAAFQNIYNQISTKYGNGQLLDPAVFNNFWNNGEGQGGKKWFVDEDGNIQNLNTPGQNKELEKNVDFEGVRGRKVIIGTDGKLQTIISEDSANSLLANWNDVPEKYRATGDYDPVKTTTTFRNGDRWSLTEDAKGWAIANKGQLYEPGNGRVYVVGEIPPVYSPGLTDRNSTGQLLFYDYVTGESVYLSSGGGGQKSSGFPSFGY